MILDVRGCVAGGGALLAVAGRPMACGRSALLREVTASQLWGSIFATTVQRSGVCAELR